MPRHPGRGTATLRLLRAVTPVPGPLVLDDAQTEALAHRGGPLRLLGGPGTGKTTTLVEIAAARVAGGLPVDQVLALTPTRQAAVALRDRIAARLAGTVREPLARSFAGLAFGVLRRQAAAEGSPPPRLLSAAEQDHILAELLAGHAGGAGRPVPWPAELHLALGTRGLRTQLRDLFARATERGLGPSDLAVLGERTGRPGWVAAAALWQEFLEVTALRAPGHYDPAALVGAAADLLEDSAELADQLRAQLRLVLVDDYQDVDPAQQRLLARLAGPGADLVVAGDPDSCVLAFRGADPRLLHDMPERFVGADGSPARTIVLETSWRRPAVLLEIGDRVAARLPGPATHRRVRPVPGAEPRGAGASVHVLRSVAQEASFIAAQLRRAHLHERVPWSHMAVLVRSVSQIAPLRRALGAAGVPVNVPAGEVAVRDQPAARMLLSALAVALDPQRLDPVTAVDLLTSPLGGADSLAVRRLRQALRAEELAGRGGRSSDELVVEALEDPAWVASLDPWVASPARRVARTLAAGRAAVLSSANAEETLWALWSASGLAEQWQRVALSGGSAGQRADRDLDAVIALFEAAARFVERLPKAGPAQFLDSLLGEEVPTDSLAERAPGAGAVTLATASSAAGREWDVVAVAGVNEGAWPDLRARGSLMQAEALVDLLEGRPVSPVATAAALAVEQARLLHLAVSRARRVLLVTAVRDEEHEPSAYLDLLDPPAPGLVESARPYSTLPRPLDLRGVVAELRQRLVEAVGASAGAPGGTGAPVGAPYAAGAPDVAGVLRGLDAPDVLAAGLAVLAAAGVPGAHPRDWFGLAQLSDAGPLRDSGEQVSVSPSRVDSFDRCALRWLLETCGGTRQDSAGQSLGTLLHELAAEAPTADAQALRAELDRRWDAADLGTGWVGAALRARAEDMVRKLADYQAAPLGELVGTEQEFEVEHGRARVHGRVDRLERDAQGRLIVVDIKTGKAKPAADEVARHAQLGIYQLAVRLGGFTGIAPGAEPGGAALVHLGDATKGTKPQVQPPLSTEPDQDWAAQLLTRVSEGMAGSDFAATVNQMCGHCPVSRCCPAHPSGRMVQP